MLLNNLARTLGDLHRLSEAADYADRAYSRAKQAGDQIVVNQSLIVRVGVYRQLGDLRRAEELLSEVESRLTRMLPPGHGAFGSLAMQHALLDQARGDFPAARAAFDRAATIAQASTQPAQVQRILRLRSDLELQMHLLDEARSDAARALDIWQKKATPGIPSSLAGRCYLALGRALAAQVKLSEARAAFASALEHLQPTLGDSHPDTRDARNLLASTHG
jgi:tetratricopeptide (TPR) repeat protein